MNEYNKDELKVAAAFVGIFLGGLFLFIVAITLFAFLVTAIFGE